MGKITLLQTFSCRANSVESEHSEISQHLANIFQGKVFLVKTHCSKNKNVGFEFLISTDSMKKLG